MRISTTLLFSLFVFLAAAQTSYTIQTVPNPRTGHGGFVANPDHILRAKTVIVLDTTLQGLQRRTSAEVAVVLVKSIGDADPFTFAQELFSHWGIGKAINDNGVLILYVEDQRTVRFHTGYGAEGVLPDAICKRIQMEKMVPAFKEGKTDEGVTAGVQEVVRILSDPDNAGEVTAAAAADQPIDYLGFSLGIGTIYFIILIIVYILKVNDGFRDSKNAARDVPTSRMTRRSWLVYYAALPLILLVLVAVVEDPVLLLASIYLFPMFLAFVKWFAVRRTTREFLKRKEYKTLEKYYSSKAWGWFLVAVAFPIPFLFIFVVYVVRMKRFRYTPRTCENCGKRMRRLNDSEEDQYLSATMLAEEKVRSVDYDVWLCTACSTPSYEFYLNEKSKYTDCPKCKALTYSVVRRTSTKEATTESEGTELVESACMHCGYKKKTTVTTPKIVESSSSSSSSWSSGSSSSWSSGSSSSSSFGGGSSGGGGASSSW